MVTFSIADRLALLDWTLVEYIIVMIIQFYYLYTDGKITMNAFETMRIAFHIGTVLVLYMLSRITVNNRIAEKNRLSEWLKKVKESDHDMEDFLSNISHELRTPVNVISGMTTILQKDNDSKELVSIQEAGIRLAHQIEDIQDYTEIKRGELVLEEENYMCISLINDMV
jgi:signal transduction histidine kinase